MQNSINFKEKNVILFIDDEHVSHVIIDIIIPRITDFKLLHAYSGLDAIDLAKEHKDELALILSDILLPDLGGYAVCEVIREHIPAIPIIFQTGLGFQESSKVLIKHPYKIISKPYTQKELGEAMKDFCL